ncbi:hypothetical protein AOLI_G00062940 [Acnodon oligacanthus]
MTIDIKWDPRKLCKDKPQTWEKYLDAEARYFSVVHESFSVLKQFGLAEMVVLMAKIEQYKIFDMDIAHLAPGKELEREVINGYIFTLVRKHNQENEDKAYMIDSFAMTKLWQGSYKILRKRSTQVIQCSHLNGLHAMDVADGSTSHVLGTHKQKKTFIAQHVQQGRHKVN